MNKAELVNYIAEKNDCTKSYAEKIIGMFTTSVMGAMAEGNDIFLIGFGNFSIRAVPAKSGRNPATGKAIEIQAHNQPKFKAGLKLKRACNK